MTLQASCAAMNFSRNSQLLISAKQPSQTSNALQCTVHWNTQSMLTLPMLTAQGGGEPPLGTHQFSRFSSPPHKENIYEHIWKQKGIFKPLV